MNEQMSALQGLKILVIDDDKVSLFLMRKILMNSGCEVSTARDAFDGWHSLMSDRPDAAIIDIVMPMADGVALFEKIRKTPELKKLPCLFMTATPTADHAKRVAYMGAAALLVKPVSAERVVVELTKIFANMPRKEDVATTTTQQSSEQTLEKSTDAEVGEGLSDDNSSAKNDDAEPANDNESTPDADVENSKAEQQSNTEDKDAA